MAEEPKSTHQEKDKQDQLQNLGEEEEEEEDEPKSPPSKVARLSSSEENPSSGIVTMASPSPLMIGLGLGMGMADSIKPAFTFMQRQELEQQALIFSYMIRGIAVPLNLVLPIWKSVAASYGPHHYPSFVGLGNLCYDFRNSMEPEPGRCRRTDGKKWRCSRDVVPDQKYCERHMHRGRNRSRKPVELADESTSAVAVPASVANVSISVASPNNNRTTATTMAAATMGRSPNSVLSTTVKPVHIED